MAQAQSAKLDSGTRFPDMEFQLVACGLDPQRTSERTGAYWETNRRIPHATGFLLRPDGTLVHAA